MYILFFSCDHKSLPFWVVLTPFFFFSTNESTQPGMIHPCMDKVSWEVRACWSPSTAGAPVNISSAFLGSHPQLAEDLCTGLFQQFKSTQPCFLPAHICMQAHTQAVSDTYKSFFSVLYPSLSLCQAPTVGHKSGQLPKIKYQRKIEQETRLLAGINFSSINKILLYLEASLLSNSNKIISYTKWKETDCRIKMERSC